MKIFLTDYASYNAGTQFKHGHWVNLTNYDADSFSEYVSKHFKSVGINDPEPMFTDYDGFDSTLYSECDLNDFFKVKEFFEQNNVDFSEYYDDDLVILARELELYEKLPVSFDSEGINILCGDDAMAIVEAVLFGNIDYNHDYIMFDNDGYLTSCNNALGGVDETDIINQILSNT